MVGKITRIAEMAYLDADKLKLLKELSEETRVPRSVLIREAIDDLLHKHGKLKTAKKKS
jgi:hypothetical protein